MNIHKFRITTILTTITHTHTVEAKLSCQTQGTLIQTFHKSHKYIDRS